MPNIEITHLLHRIGDGDELAEHELLELVYDELRSLAAAKLRRESSSQSLSVTALVHEAWLRMNPTSETHSRWENRRHYFAAAAEAMRRILVDQARRRGTVKRSRHRVAEFDIATVVAPDGESELDMIAVAEALDELRAADPQSASILELRFFAGLQLLEIAEVMQLSRATVVRELTFAKCWIKSRLSD